MIEAGTIRAYLTLSSHDFTSNLNGAMAQLVGMGSQCAAASGAAAGLGAAMDTLSSGGLKRMSDAVRRSISESRLMSVSITSDYSNAASSVASKTSELAGRISSNLNSVQSQARQAMVRAGEGMIAGLNSMRGAILAKASSVAAGAAAAMRSALKIASPSRVTREIGEQTAMGMAFGISDMQAETEKRARKLAAAAVSSMSSVRSDGLKLDLKANQQVTERSVGADVSQLSGKLDMLIDALLNSRQTMEVDGRSFARLIREYV